MMKCPMFTTSVPTTGGGIDPFILIVEDLQAFVLVLPEQRQDLQICVRPNADLVRILDRILTMAWVVVEGSVSTRVSCNRIEVCLGKTESVSDDADEATRDFQAGLPVGKHGRSKILGGFLYPPSLGK